MSIFGSIVSKIFGHASAAPAAPGTSPSPAPSSTTTAGSAPAGGSSFNNPAPQSAAPGQTAAQSTAAAPAAPVDVAAVLADLASKNGQTLDWKRSIVDLLKLLGLDSSLSARQELAKELNYSGSTSDSATMNIWLHKQVMQKLADNGGKVPEELRT